MIQSSILYTFEVIMTTFIEFLQIRDPELFAEASKEGLGSRLLKLAKKMPYTTTALAGTAGLLGGTHAYEKSVGSDEHPKAAKVEKELLPPLKKSKAKIVDTIEDSGRA